MRTLSIDIETYSPVSLVDFGVYKYANDPEFEILLFGYAYDNDPVQVIDLACGEQLSMSVIQDLYNPEVLKTAFNANFELTCLTRWLTSRGLPELLPEQWDCTAVMASELGLPRTLAKVGEAIGLPEEQQKLKTGKALIRFFSIPCAPTKKNGERTRNLPEHDPERWALYKEYNAGDVVSERAIRQRLSGFRIDRSEHDLWVCDQAINNRGVMVDAQLAQNAVDFDAIIKARLLDQAKELTGLDNPKSTSQIKSWIQDETGMVIDSLDKKHIADVRTRVAGTSAEDLLDIRAQLSKTSTSKYEKMLGCACDDDRIRGLTQFYGASRTGRWAGRLVQMQNLPQNHLPDDDLDCARQILKNGDLETFEMMFDDTADILSQLIRTAFIPRPGSRFIVSDFSAIEARMLAWLADESWRMEVFRTHGKIYEASAEQMFHLPPGSVKKGDPMRQKGKIAELALGYGGAEGALKSMGALNMGLGENELRPLVKAWRDANKAITKFWWDTDAAFRHTIETGQMSYLPRGIVLRKSGPLLRLKLPSGRELSYVKPMITADGSITYEGTVQKTNAWGRIETYGPKIVENITQAASRDCLAHVIKRLEKEDYRVVFHVHDEVICEVPNGRSSADELAALMGEAIPWCPDLPLKAAAYECDYYKKD